MTPTPSVTSPFVPDYVEASELFSPFIWDHRLAILLGTISLPFVVELFPLMQMALKDPIAFSEVMDGFKAKAISTLNEILYKTADESQEEYAMRIKAIAALGTLSVTAFSLSFFYLPFFCVLTAVKLTVIGGSTAFAKKQEILSFLNWIKESLIFDPQEEIIQKVVKTARLSFAVLAFVSTLSAEVFLKKGSKERMCFEYSITAFCHLSAAVYYFKSDKGMIEKTLNVVFHIICMQASIFIPIEKTVLVDSYNIEGHSILPLLQWIKDNTPFADIIGVLPSFERDRSLGALAFALLPFNGTKLLSFFVLTDYVSQLNTPAVRLLVNPKNFKLAQLIREFNYLHILKRYKEIVLPALSMAIGLQFIREEAEHLIEKKEKEANSLVAV